jgi:serine/threonine protein kinase
MGSVFEAFDAERGQSVAMKTLKKVDALGLMRLKKEFRALADLSHPGLIGLYELVSEGDEWFFTMELVQGADFQTWVCGTPPAFDGPHTDSTATDSSGGSQPFVRPVATPVASAKLQSATNTVQPE